jgi:hypothetical protein
MVSKINLKMMILEMIWKHLEESGFVSRGNQDN